MNKKQKCHVTRIGPKANESFESLDVPCLAAFKKKQHRPRFPDVEGNINACRKCIAAKKRRRQSSTFEACAPWQHSHQHWPHCQTSSRARVTSKSCLYGGWPKFLLPEMAILGKKYFRETPQKKKSAAPYLGLWVEICMTNNQDLDKGPPSVCSPVTLHFVAAPLEHLRLVQMLVLAHLRPALTLPHPKNKGRPSFAT